MKCPVLVKSRALRRDSAGPGKFRGGLGIDLEVRNFVDGKWNFERANAGDVPRGDCGEANPERAAAIICAIRAGASIG